MKWVPGLSDMKLLPGAERRDFPGYKRGDSFQKSHSFPSCYLPTMTARSRWKEKNILSLGGYDSVGDESEVSLHDEPVYAIDKHRRWQELLRTQEAADEEEEEETEKIVESPSTPEAFLNSFYEFHEEEMRGRDCNRNERYVHEIGVTITTYNSTY